MKTDPLFDHGAAPDTPSVPADPAPAEAIHPQSGALGALLQRPAQQHALPGQVDGLLIGLLQAVDAAGRAQVHLIDFACDPLDALSMVPLGPSDIGTRLVVGFQGGAVSRPVILGRVWSPEAAAPACEAAPVPVEVTPQRRIVLAEESLELRCGEAVILLRADGHIHLRGRTITSHAEAGQRIRGGSVQIN